MVRDLLERTVTALTEKGYKPYWVDHYMVDDTKGLPEITIEVDETFRRNHRDEENVTVTIEIVKWHKPQGNEWLTPGKRIAKIKVPKDASEKVLNNRVDKAIEIYKQNED